jgi:hypothetical protein
MAETLSSYRPGGAGSGPDPVLTFPGGRHPTDDENPDLVAYALVAERHKREIGATLPLGADVDKVWGELQVYFIGFIRFRHRRAQARKRGSRKRWERTLRLIDDLAIKARLAQQESRSYDCDPDLPMRLLAELAKFRTRAEAHVTVNRNWGGKLFGAKRNPHRELLYAGILKVWTGIGGTLTYGRPAIADKPKPNGPLIDFFAACIEPILDKAQSPYTTATIIDRAVENTELNG